MVFNSYHFLIFFPIVIAVYFVIPRKLRYLWLLVASYYFYMSWNPRYAVLIALSTVITFLSGLLLPRARGTAAKKLVVAGSFLTNLGILAFFKYFDFLLSNLNLLLTSVGISAIQKPFDIILPVGISFYTFQALSYTVDVYRGDIQPEKNFFRYALFVSFFPQLVAGPIERSKNLLSQVDRVEEFQLWDYERITRGAVLMLFGLFQKMVIADRISAVVDQVYNSYWMYGSIELLLATVCFSAQIYCDFGSYSLIAIGAARVMGFDLMENFNVPYAARSIREFWARWHISLSSWLKDYLYIPLGGNRCSRWKNYRNIMVTFLVSGLWHGANWTFIVWGALHGLYQIAGKILGPAKEKFNRRFAVRTGTFSYRLGQRIVTFALVNFAWIFFRADTIRGALGVVRRIFTSWDPWVLFDQSLYMLGLDQTEVHILLAALLLLFLADLVRCKKGITLDVFLEGECLWFRWACIFLLFYFILIFGIYGPAFEAKQFIYFQF